jgi:uncharacterized protein with GYD domain
MPHYLGRFSYSADSIRAMVDNPQDRADAARQAIESVGGKLLGFWFAFGDCDGVFIAEAPDNTSVAALSMLVGGTGALSKLETTVLIGMDEAQEAMRKAGSASYRPPAG